MNKPLMAALDSITIARPPVRLVKLGASVFVPRPKWGLRWHFFPWRRELLHRVIRSRISDTPTESKVDWTKGKGTIGACWKTGRPTLHDRRAAAAIYGKDRYPSEKYYAALPETVTCGFSHSEFMRTIDKYGEILAVPIVRRSGDIIGVLSIDCVANAYPDAQAPSILGGDDIEEFATRAGLYVRDDVAKF